MCAAAWGATKREGTGPTHPSPCCSPYTRLSYFLKGAILSRSPSADIKTHNLSDLWRLYRDTLPGDEFEFDMPFQSEYIGFTEEEAAALAKDEPLPSIMHRYPVNKDLLPWAGIQCFEAPPFRAMLERLLETFDGVWGKVRGV